MTIFPIILSGGAGTRLWPLSINEHPKQFLSLFSEKTMIQETILRLKNLDIEPPIVTCNESHRFLVAHQLSAVLEEKSTIILEPTSRNTAPAIATACCAAKKQDKDAIVIVLPSDHVIKNEATFRIALENAIDEAKNGYLVTFGIIPTFPATGYGYIKSGNQVNNISILEKFVEKPCLQKAQEYLDSGEYSWNSGMFVFKADTFLMELKKFNLELYNLAYKSFENATFEEDFIRLNKDYYEQIKSDSIDYAVMEKTTKGKVIKLDAGWNDVGSWAAIYDINSKDENNNVIKGDAITIDTKNCYINGSSKTIATIGLDNIVIVESDDSILISKKEDVQKVKDITEILKTK